MRIGDILNYFVECEDSKQYKLTKRMPSGPFIYFFATRIQAVLTRYLETKFSMSPHLASFYMQLMSCPSCVCTIDGWWRHQVNTLVMKALDLLCQSGDMEEIQIFDLRISCEFNLVAGYQAHKNLLEN